MGQPGKRSALYLLLFKQLFGTVIHLRGENEEMLRPHLEAIVNGALTNSRQARDPENYFMLLRSLFRSISGGVHERLYQEFLPLLPRLLRQMNKLQTALHRPEMHDLFIELCLTGTVYFREKKTKTIFHFLGQKVCYPIYRSLCLGNFKHLFPILLTSK